MIDRNDDGEIRRRTGEARSGGLRHAMAVPALIQAGERGSINAQIHDVSRDGMFLRHAMLVEKGDVEALRAGMPVTVTFVPDPLNAPEEAIRLSAEIVRRLPHGIGVRFLELSDQHKRALRILARQAVESRTPSPASEKPRGATREARAVLGACRQVIEHRIPNIIWTLRTELATQLRRRRAADAAGVPVDARKDAQAIEDKGLAIGRTIERRVMQTFAELAGLDDTQEVLLTRIQQAKIKAARAGGEPVLLDNATLENSVAMGATGRRFESMLAGKSFEVNVRLANVIGRRIDNLENPLVPAVMCRMLWQSVTDQYDSPHVRARLHDVLIAQIVPLLSELYDEIDAALTALGVPRAFGNNGA